MVASGGDETEAVCLGFVLRTSCSRTFVGESVLCRFMEPQHSDSNHLTVLHSFPLPTTTLQADGSISDRGAVPIYSELTKILQEGTVEVPRLAAGRQPLCLRLWSHDRASALICRL